MQNALKLGMSVSEFYECTPRDLYNFFKGRSEGLAEQREHELECTRQIMWASIAAMNGNKIRPHELIPLPKDKKNIKQPTPFELQELRKWAEQQDREMGII